jgi:N-methylhydantoinase A
VSAGADPGPACYALGGEEPTVTDAKLITGVLNPDYFAAGRLKLDIERAGQAMRKIADGLGTNVMEAAVAVIRVVDASMIEALKLVSIQRGHDPRDFALVVGGGGGAMLAGALGRELGVKAIIVPLYPGLFSAWGMLVTEPRRDFTQTSLCRAESIEIHDIRALFSRLRQEPQESLRTDQRPPENELTFEYRWSMCPECGPKPTSPGSWRSLNSWSPFCERKWRLAVRPTSPMLPRSSLPSMAPRQ